MTLGWDIGRVVESGDPLDEAMEKAVADYKATMSQLDKADLMASLVVSKIMQGEPYTLATERDFEGRLQSIADHVGATMEISWLDQADHASCPTSRTSEHSRAGARGCDVRMFGCLPLDGPHREGGLFAGLRTYLPLSRTTLTQQLFGPRQHRFNPTSVCSRRSRSDDHGSDGSEAGVQRRCLDGFPQPMH